MLGFIQVYMSVSITRETARFREHVGLRTPPSSLPSSLASVYKNKSQQENFNLALKPETVAHWYSTSKAKSIYFL